MISRHVYSATLHHGSSEYPLSVRSGSVERDESWAPHIRADLTVAMPDAETLDALDPRESVRVLIAADSSSGSSASWDLGLRDRRINHREGTVDLSLTSDEALLMGNALIWTGIDDTALLYQDSIRALIDAAVLEPIGAVLEPGDTDAPVPSLPSARNLVPNPSAEYIPGVGVGCTASQSTAWAKAGTHSHHLHSPTSPDSYLLALATDMTAGGTYTAYGTIRLAGPLSGTIDTSRARSIVVIVDPGTGPYVLTTSQSAPNAASETDLDVTFTLPDPLVAAEVRYYLGATGGEVWWDAARVTPGPAIRGEVYFDGDTPDSDAYAYAWEGTPGYSISNRTALHGRTPDALTRMPGDTLWDLISPVLPTLEMRLYCDGERKWHLIPSDYVAEGHTDAAIAENLIDVTDSIDLSGDEFFDAVVVRYRWTDPDGVAREAYDVAGPASPAAATVIEYNRPYPGPGAAAYILRRAQGRGRTLTGTTVSDYAATPSQSVTITAPPAPVQTGLIRSVRWDLGSDEMTLTTRGLTDTPESD